MRRARGLLAAALTGALLLLGACGGGRDPDAALLSVQPANMEGVTRATVVVRATGPWSLAVTSEGGALDGRVSLDQLSGVGQRSVTLRVDPDGVAPGRYRLRLWLDADTEDGPTSVRRDVVFAFPRVHGNVIVIPDDQARQLVASSEASRPGAVDAAVNPDGSVTLIVGAERALAVSLAGQPSARSTFAPTALASLATLAPGKVTFEFPEAGVLLVDVPAQEAGALGERLLAAPGILSVWPSVELKPLQAGFPNDSHFPRQWNLTAVGLPAAWEMATGLGVRIAVIDGGFYPAHPDLSGKVQDQHDFGDDRPDVTVEHAACGTHGTHVAGIAAAATDNGIGVAGAAPGAGLLLLDIDRFDGVGCMMVAADLLKALAHIYNDGAPLARVVNMSIGSASPLGPGIESALAELRAAGVVLVAAAGNTESDCSGGGTTPVTYPAAYASVWAIAATGPSDERACYSHAGPQVLLAAPGGDSRLPPEFAAEVFSTVYDVPSQTADYDYMQGTSMAAPVVAGVLALMLEVAPDATESQLREALTSTATDLGPDGRDDLHGHGLVRAELAVAAIAEVDPSPPDPLGLILDVAGYPLTPLRYHREFVLVDAPPGPLTVRVYSDDDEDGVGGEPGEYLGVAVLDVAFDQDNDVTVAVRRQ